MFSASAYQAQQAAPLAAKDLRGAFAAAQLPVVRAITTWTTRAATTVTTVKVKMGGR